MAKNEIVVSKIQVIGVESVKIPIYESKKDENGNIIKNNFGKVLNEKIGEKDGYKYTYVITWEPLDFSKIINGEFPEIRTDILDSYVAVTAKSLYFGFFEERAELIEASEKISFSKGRKVLIKIKEDID